MSRGRNGRRGRALASVRLAVICSLPVMSPIAGASFLAEAQETASAAAPIAPAPVAPAPITPATAGRTPDGAFFIDLRQGLDRKTQSISHFDVDNEHSLMVFRSENAEFTKEGLHLFARRSEDADKPYTVGEFQQRGFYGYGRYEAVMRASDVVGVVSAFFTHTSGMFGDPHTEIDFEFVGKKPRELHLNYFAGDKNDPVNIPLWFDASKAEHLYVFEWSPDAITWYVDGVRVRKVTSRTSSIGLPTNSSRVIANILTGARATEDWVGTPDFDSALASFSCISHVPIGQTGKQCSDVFTLPKP